MLSSTPAQIGRTAAFVRSALGLADPGRSAPGFFAWADARAALGPTVAFLAGTAGYARAELAATPQLLAYSLPNRIGPRHAFARRAFAARGLAAPVPLLPLAALTLDASPEYAARLHRALELQEAAEGAAGAERGVRARGPGGRPQAEEEARQVAIKAFQDDFRAWERDYKYRDDDR
jgi:hypothetical protein